MCPTTTHQHFAVDITEDGTAHLVIRDGSSSMIPTYDDATRAALVRALYRPGDLPEHVHSTVRVITSPDDEGALSIHDGRLVDENGLEALNAERLAVAMALPEVRTLVHAVGRSLAHGCLWHEGDHHKRDVKDISDALAKFAIRDPVVEKEKADLAEKIMDEHYRREEAIATLVKAVGVALPALPYHPNVSKKVRAELDALRSALAPFAKDNQR